MMKIIIFVLSIALAHSCLAFEINGKVDILESKEVWKQGDVIRSKITMWPIETADKELMKKSLEGNSFGEIFFVSDVKKIEFSKNNPQALEIIANLTLSKIPKAYQQLVWSYKALQVNVQIPKIKYEPQQLQSNDYLIIDSHNVDLAEKYIWLYVLMGLSVAAIAIFFSIKIYKKKQIRQEAIFRKEKWRKLITDCKKREEYEEVYRTRSEWLEYFGGENPQFLQLFDTIDKYQYMKEWNEEVYSEIEFIHSEIRDTL